MERVKRSDTWLRARNGATRGALLLLWSEAWMQAPCGSLPNDDELISLIIDMDPAEFQSKRAVLMRGWWLAEDGRLYHDVVVERALEMLATKEKDRARKAGWRARKSTVATAGTTPDGGACPTGQDSDMDECPAGQTGDSDRKDNTGTGTGTGKGIGIPTLVAKAQENSARTARAPDDDEDHGPPSPITPTAAGLACKAMRAAGLPDANPAHPRLIAALQAGVTVDELVLAAQHAAKTQKGFVYAIATAIGRREDAVKGTPPPGSLQAQADPESRSAIEADGIAMGIGPWDETKEQWHQYKRRVRPAPSVAPSIARLVAERMSV